MKRLLVLFSIICLVLLSQVSLAAVCISQDGSGMEYDYHSYGDWEKDSGTMHKKVCMVCNDTIREPHGPPGTEYGQTDENHYLLCSKCGDRYSPTKHSFGTNHKCTDCGRLSKNGETHVFDSTGKCKICGTGATFTITGDGSFSGLAPKEAYVPWDPTQYWGGGGVSVTIANGVLDTSDSYGSLSLQEFVISEKTVPDTSYAGTVSPAVSSTGLYYLVGAPSGPTFLYGSPFAGCYISKKYIDEAPVYPKVVIELYDKTDADNPVYMTTTVDTNVNKGGTYVVTESDIPATYSFDGRDLEYIEGSRSDGKSRTEAVTNITSDVLIKAYYKAPGSDLEHNITVLYKRVSDGLEIKAQESYPVADGEDYVLSSDFKDPIEYQGTTYTYVRTDCSANYLQADEVTLKQVKGDVTVTRWYDVGEEETEHKITVLYKRVSDGLEIKDQESYTVKDGEDLVLSSDFRSPIVYQEETYNYVKTDCSTNNLQSDEVTLKQVKSDVIVTRWYDLGEGEQDEEHKITVLYKRVSDGVEIRDQESYTVKDGEDYVLSDDFRNPIEYDGVTYEYVRTDCAPNYLQSDEVTLKQVKSDVTVIRWYDVGEEEILVPQHKVIIQYIYEGKDGEELLGEIGPVSVDEGAYFPLDEGQKIGDFAGINLQGQFGESAKGNFILNEEKAYIDSTKYTVPSLPDNVQVNNDVVIKFYYYKLAEYHVRVFTVTYINDMFQGANLDSDETIEAILYEAITVDKPEHDGEYKGSRQFSPKKANLMWMTEAVIKSLSGASSQTITLTDDDPVMYVGLCIYYQE
jgi:hypothetical protein